MMSESEKREILAILENVVNANSEEERQSYDPAWLAGYVTGQIHAAEMLIELERGE